MATFVVAHGTVAAPSRVTPPPGPLSAPAVALTPISLADLLCLARNETPPHLGCTVIDGALPPAFVAARALQQWQAGTPPRWCSTFYTLRRADQVIVGACGFKFPPHGGRVEIGYGIAERCRGLGYGRQAVAELLTRAFDVGEPCAAPAVREVLAQVNPDNGPSTRVVRSLGFQNEGLANDAEGELLVQWVFRRPRLPLPP